VRGRRAQFLKLRLSGGPHEQFTKGYLKRDCSGVGIIRNETGLRKNEILLVGKTHPSRRCPKRQGKILDRTAMGKSIEKEREGI